MSSIDLEKSFDQLIPADRLLVLLKRSGPQTSTQLAKQLGITGEAARQQLQRLLEEGVVTVENQVKGVGRPSQVWRLTSKGNCRFPDAHAGLTAQILASVRNVLGEEALQRVIQAREKDALSNYGAVLSQVRTLEEKVALLAEMRSREGYMAEWHREGAQFVLIENHCPICKAASACQGLCEAELNAFSAVLGEDVEVVRQEHIVSGGRRCLYRITPKTDSIDPSGKGSA